MSNYTPIHGASEARMAALLNNASWRITAPMRRVVSALRGLIPNNLKTHGKILLHQAARYVMARPGLRNVAVTVLDRFPTVRSRLTRIFVGAAAQGPTDLALLTPRARQIYADLKTAIERRQKDNG